MAASARNTLKTLHQKLQKEYKANAVLLPNDREILEHLVYAAFLENAPFPAALEAFEVLENYFIDWNELRVSTTAELVDILGMLPFPQRTCERIRQTLQWIFQTTYKFDLEQWRKKDAKAFREFLVGIPFVTRFMTDYLVRRLFNQNVIPLDEGAMRVMRLLDLVDIDSENREVVKEMDRVFSRQDSELFFILLHQLSATMMKEGLSKSIQKLLKSIDPESEERSYIPLVESNDEKDPSQIAKSMAAKQTRRPARFEIDETDLLDDSDDLDFIEGTDGNLEEGLTPYNPEEAGEEYYVSKTEIKERPASEEKGTKSSKKGTAKKAGEEKSGSGVGRKTQTESGRQNVDQSGQDKADRKGKSVSAVTEEKAAPSKVKPKKDSAKDKKLKEIQSGKNKPKKSDKVSAPSERVKKEGKGNDVSVKAKKTKGTPSTEGGVSAEMTENRKKRPSSAIGNRDAKPSKNVGDQKKDDVKKERSKRKQETVAELRTSKRRSGPPPEKSKISVIKKGSVESGQALSAAANVSKTKKLKQKKPR